MSKVERLKPPISTMTVEEGFEVTIEPSDLGIPSATDLPRTTEQELTTLPFPDDVDVGSVKSTAASDEETKEDAMNGKDETDVTPRCVVGKKKIYFGLFGAVAALFAISLGFGLAFSENKGKKGIMAAANLDESEVECEETFSSFTTSEQIVAGERGETLFPSTVPIFTATGTTVRFYMVLSLSIH